MLENELHLVLEAVSGNADSFGRLAEHYSPTILGLVYTQVGDLETARDITQETMLKAYTSLGSLRQPDRFGSWLRQIAVNLARTQLRSQSRRPQVSIDDEAAPPRLPEQGETGLERTVERKMARQELLHALQAVPEGPRAALVMHYLVGLAPAEAAQRLGVSRAAFDTRLSRGREMLRRELTRIMEETLTEARDEVAIYLEGIAQRVKSALQDGQRERVLAAKELSLLAARANHARLIRDLRAPDETIRKQAAQLMGDTLDRRFAQPLMEALPAEEEPAVQAEICRSLAKIGVTDAVPLLHKVSRNTADMTVHKAASEAMKELEALANGVQIAEADIPVTIDDLKAAGIEALFLEMLADQGAPVRVQAADGLGRVESVKAIPELVKVLAGDPQEYVRRAAAEALGAILWSGRTTKEKVTPAKRDKAVAALAEALGDASIGVQGEAGWSLCLVTPPEHDALRRQVMARFWDVIEGALKRPGPWWVTFPPMVGALGSEEDQLRIAELLFRPDLRFKGPLCHMLTLLARPERTAVNARIRAAVEQGVFPKCNHELLNALGKSLDPAVLPFLLERLNTADPKERTAAARALAGYPNGPNLLRTALEAPGRDEGVTLALVGALEPIATPDDVTLLEDVATRLSPKGAITARAAAKRIGAR